MIAAAKFTTITAADWRDSLALARSTPNAVSSQLSEARDVLLAELDEMLNELEASCLEVILVPNRRFVNQGGMNRCAVSKNAKWYRDFCAQYPSSRVRRNAAFDTRIKRQDTLAVLRRLLSGRKSTSSYAPVLLGIARRRAANPLRTSWRERERGGQP